MKKSRVFLSALLFVLTALAPAGAGELIPEKIVLGRFEVTEGKIVLKKSDPDWPTISRNNLAVDDFGRIYVLNVREAKIMVYGFKGRVLRRIKLPVKKYDTEFSGKASSSSSEGFLMVSGRGDIFWVETPSRGGSPGDTGFRQKRQFILSQSGLVIKEYKGDEMLPEFPGLRNCENTYQTEDSGEVYDENFKKIGKKGAASDSLEKTLSLLPPDPFPFLSEDEKIKLKPQASGEIFSSLTAACNGDVYRVYHPGALPPAAFKRWLENGEYFVYKYKAGN